MVHQNATIQRAQSSHPMFLFARLARHMDAMCMCDKNTGETAIGAFLAA
jgi:hypothetical protein